MVKPLKVGIAGCGAIGGSLARSILKDFRRQARISGLYDIDGQKARGLSRALGNRIKAVGTLEALIGEADLVIEAASARASFLIAKEALARGKDVLVMSVGGLLAAGRVKRLERLCRTRGARLYVPSGALAGIDAVKASAAGRITSVTLTTIKHPRSFAGVAFVEKKGIALNSIRRDTVLFSGTAEEAVTLFPQNINVAAVLSLAGLGAARTRVKIIASPGASRNVHEVAVESAAGKVFARTENVVHPDNPKTSYLAVLSAVACVRQILAPVRVGT